MIPLRTIAESDKEGLILFINDYFRLIANEINHNLRPEYLRTFTKEPERFNYRREDGTIGPGNIMDGTIGYFPCRPKDLTFTPPHTKPNYPMADFDPGSGQGIYIYMINWQTKPYAGKWYKLTTTPVP